MTASQHTVDVSRPTFIPDPLCRHRPVYDLARDMAETLAFDDGDLFRPLTIPADLVEGAVNAGYILIDREMIARDSREGNAFVALLADNLHRLCTEAILSRRDSGSPAHEELLTAHEILTDAYRRYAECDDPEDAPRLFQLVEQAEAHVDRLGWEALVRHKITALPSLLFAFLTTDEPTRAVRVCT